MEEEDHFTQTLLPALSHCCTWQQGCCPWQPLTFSLDLSHSALSHSHFALSLSVSFYRQPWHLLNNGCTWVDTFVNGGCNYHWQMVTLLLRIGCSLMANPNRIFISFFGQMCPHLENLVSFPILIGCQMDYVAVAISVNFSMAFSCQRKILEEVLDQSLLWYSLGYMASEKRLGVLWSSSNLG